MNRPVVLRRAAETDIVDIFTSLQQVRDGLGDQFVDHVRTILERIEAMPEMYGLVWNDVRAVRVRKFLYVVYYVALADRIEVLAVIHGSRHETDWQSRAAT